MSDSYVLSSRFIAPVSNLHLLPSLTSSLMSYRTWPPWSSVEGGKKRKLTRSEIARYFHLPLTSASKELGVCTTLLKKLCRRYASIAIFSQTMLMRCIEGLKGPIVPSGAKHPPSSASLLHHCCFTVFMLLFTFDLEQSITFLHLASRSHALKVEKRDAPF